MNFANVTLGELLSHTNDIIKRNALSILKQLQKERDHEHTKCRHGVFRLKGLPPCRECEYKKNTLSPSSKH